MSEMVLSRRNRAKLAGARVVFAFGGGILAWESAILEFGIALLKP
jgi:hypothetical protein